MAEHDYPRDGDAERLAKLTERHPIMENREDRSYWGEEDIPFLLRQLRARDAALRDARADIERLKADLAAPTKDHDVNKMVVAITAEDLVFRLRQHVRSRGAPHLPNGAWALMLEAANQIESLHQAIATAETHGWDTFRNSVKDRLWSAKEPFYIKDALEIINTHHQTYYGAIADRAPEVKP